MDGLKLASSANNGAGVTSQELLKQQTGHTYVGPGSAITQADVRPGTTADYYAALASRDAAQGGQGGYYDADVSTPEGMNALLEQIRSEQNIIDRGNTNGSFNAQETTVPEVSAQEAADYTEFIKQIYAKQLEQELAELSAQYESGRNQTAAQSEIARRNFSEQANVMGNLPEGFTSPVRISVIQLPTSCPGWKAQTTASASPFQEAVSTGLQMLRTTTSFLPAA